MLAYLPALLLALFTLGGGTFSGGATAAGAASGHLALLAMAALAGASAADPLRLGRAGRLLPLALWLAVGASAWASPVPRAGRVGVLLLPAFLLLPPAVARCWSGVESRRRGVRAVTLLLGAVALYALWDVWARGSPRAAMPLGHHNLLAGWLVTLLPLALVPLRRPGAWRPVAAACGLVGVVAVAATRSLLGAAALGLEALVALLWIRRWHRWLIVVGLLIAASQMPRALSVLAGTDPSARAREVYLEAGWRGFRARPLLGWGPGSAAWTAADFLRPLPGVNPPGEVVGDLHSLPVQALYEVGLTGFLLTAAVLALFLLRRLRARALAPDPAASPEWAAAGVIALLGAAFTRLGGASLLVTALPVAVAVAAGAALAGTVEGGGGGGAGPRRRLWAAAPLLYALVAGAFLLPLDLAHLAYDRAAHAATVEEARRHLQTAVRLDPGFPLYRARLAWLADAGDATAARAALGAAEAARGLFPLYLAAGPQGVAAGEDWAPAALARACALDPLGALAPFHLLTADPRDPRAPDRGARALLAEPRLLAATAWRGREEVRAVVLRRLRFWPGVDPGWRRALAEAAARAAAAPAGGATAALGLEMDAVPYLSFSLHAFRRRPWPAVLAPVEVDAAAAQSVRLPAATRLETTGREALRAGCDLD